MELKDALKYVTHIGVRDKIEREGLTEANSKLLQRYITDVNVWNKLKTDGFFDNTTADTDADNNGIADAVEIKIVYAKDPADVVVELPAAKVVGDGVKDGYKLIKADLPVLSVDDYTFNGWFNGDAEVKKGTIITADVTLTAKFTKKELVVAPEEPVGPTGETGSTGATGESGATGATSAE